MPEIVCIYKYIDLAGNIRHETVRYKPKDFRQRRPDGKGGYIWSLNGIEPILYHLPEITKAIREGKPILLCAGEKDADNGARWGFITTTCPAGEGNWRDSYTETLRGSKLIIIPDLDEKGQKAALEVAERLWNVCEIVKMVRLEFPANAVKKKDLTDWIEAGGTVQQLKNLIDDAPIFTPLGYLQQYEDWLILQDTKHLFQELEYLKTAPAKYAGCVTPLLNRFLFIRDSIEFQPKKKGGIDLRYAAAST